MKKTVKLVIYFLGTLLVGSILMFVVKNPFYFHDFFSGMDFSFIKKFFTDFGLKNSLFVLGLFIAIVLGIFSFRYMRKKKGKKSMKKSKKKESMDEEREKEKEKPKLKPRLKRKLDNLKGIKTKMDVFYFEIRDKEKISISNLSKEFGISKDKTLDWCKMLEKEEMVKIEYPTFSSPVVKLKEKEESEDEKEGDKKGKNNDKKSKTNKKHSGKKTKKKPKNKKSRGKAKTKSKKKSRKSKKKKSSRGRKKKNKSKRGNK